MWCPIRPKGDHNTGPDEDTRASEPMMSGPMISESVISMPMASMPMALVPMPAPVGVPWHGACQEQHREHAQYSYPLRPCSHGNHLSSHSVLPLRYAS